MLTGAKLRAIRALLELTQAELAERSGVSPTAIAEFEGGKRDLRASTIRRLCEAMGVRIYYVVNDTQITGP